MKKYIVKKAVPPFTEKGETFREMEMGYCAENYVSYILPSNIVENHPEHFEEIKQKICPECGKPLDTTP